ncbi:hypothetical protein S40288_06536 [Stachybotrys chartarum IBT 40288]|nr:hypothetical protein S40288_06536 [Stachybotrys chartarum IBT 40288]
MFSPSVAEGGPATATRSRRRQRPRSSEENVQQPKAKRQRLPLTEQTFVNPDVPPEMTQVKSGKIVATLNDRTENIENVNPTPRREISTSLRVKKPKHADRAANKGDGSLLLTSTSAYTVSKLPALPDRIRSDWLGSQHAEIFSSSGYALTLTPTHAIVWPYTSTSPSPETFTFDLPSAPKSSEPLPVGSLVSPSASSTEPGLVVVMAGSGKVVYWESISSAATFAFIKKDRSGVEHTIGGMLSGEKVVAITNAEPAGFILTFNTGRLAYLTVRDGHGRPFIAVRFLRTSFAATNNSLFGSIRHAFSNLSLRGHVAAVRPDRSSRVGERNIVALTAKGKLQSWRIHRGGQEEALGGYDAREDLIQALREHDPKCKDFPEDSFEAIDFTFVPKGLESKYLDLSRLSEAMAFDDPAVQHLLLLVSLTKKSESRYALIEVIQTASECKIGMIRPISSYSTPIPQSDSSDFLRPRIYLPRPALVAYIVFDRAAVIASVAIPPESPDAQLQSDNHLVPASFEDVVDFREDNIHEIVGSGFEESAPASSGHDESKAHRQRSKNPAAVLFVRGAGIVRIVTTDIDKFASDQSPQVSAKSKLEQAVFFGRRSDNPLTFGSRKEIKFSREEIARAALEVSHEILASTTSYISTLPAAMEDNLQERSNALERLVVHLDLIGADLDRTTRWNLLYNAEKMHVAHQLWRHHEAFTAARPADDKESLIAMIVEFIHQDQKSKPQRHLGQLDALRHWFISDVFRLELMVAWAYEVIKTLYKNGILEESKMTLLMHEAVVVNICTQKEALGFRKDNLARYGLQDETLQNGILLEGYEGLPEPWTGCHYVANNIKRLTELSWEWIKVRISDDKSKTNKADMALLEKIFRDTPELTHRMLTSTLEYALWAETSSDQKELGHDFLLAYNTDKYERPVTLARFGRWLEAAQIAEKHKSLDALAVILQDHIMDLEDSISQPNRNVGDLRRMEELLQNKRKEMESCILRFGQSFAFPLYEYLLVKHGVEAVLGFDLDKRGFKTKFLRTKPELARIAWINEIQHEKDIGRAATTLVDLGLHKEQQVWNKKIELSLGKLALLAEAEEAGSLKIDEARNEENLKKVDKELITVKIQDQLYDLVSPCTRAAVDDAAALHFAMETHSTNIPRRQKALYQVFEDGMKRLLRHEALDAMTLIDLLTLIALSPEARAEIANPFWLALKVAESSCHKDEMKEAKRLIWRRLYIRDDWAKINDTTLKDDRQVVERLADTELFLMMVDCIRFRRSTPQPQSCHGHILTLVTEDSQAEFRPMPVRDSLGAFTEHLDRRFRDFDGSFQTKLLEAMKWEDKVLSQYMEKNQLEGWSQTTFDSAKVDVKEQLDEATRAGAAE